MEDNILKETFSHPFSIPKSLEIKTTKRHKNDKRKVNHYERQLTRMRRQVCR